MMMGNLSKEWLEKEWLVTDALGGFAMGTASGIRTRKYHGFYSSIAGRSQTSFLSGFELTAHGIAVWPHAYSSSTVEDFVFHPIPSPYLNAVSLGMNPKWSWTLSGNEKLEFSVQGVPGIGIQYVFKRTAKSKNLPPMELKIRPFFALRSLHATGGQPWTIEPLGAHRYRIVGVNGLVAPEALLQCDEKWVWTHEPHWYEKFYYSEELERGYDYQESQFSAGVFTVSLQSQTSFLITENLRASEVADLSDSAETSALYRSLAPNFPLKNFILTSPPGIVAGFPWFGEWGRDTFIALPGVIAGWLAALQLEPDARHLEEAVYQWCSELLERWGAWIESAGLLPNLIEKEGTHQWESADATLWWIHSLTALWQYSLGPYPVFNRIQKKFSPFLDQAIASIRTGKHAFLRVNAQGLIEMTEPHATWMDARIGGQAVTPRCGTLPEINALWCQALALQSIWKTGQVDQSLESVFIAAIDQTDETERPNRIFLYSLPLAPGFILQDDDLFLDQIETIKKHFGTPVGLRTLTPADPRYQKMYLGDQTQRDGAYHQGTVWAWLGGHYLMAQSRCGKNSDSSFEMFSHSSLEKMPISGHIPEIFDAESPFHPRGAPAQAWSLACLEEFKIRKKMKLDQPLLKLIRVTYKKKRVTRANSAKSHRKPVDENRFEETRVSKKNLDVELT